MVPGEEKAEVSLSSEFFKKLNQQIVQKDNLIKLLQLQIKNLKSQLDESATDTQKKDDAGRLLETKESEISQLKAELEEQKANVAKLAEEKDEQIHSLNRIIEEQKQAEPLPTEMVDASGLAELQTQVDQLAAALEAEKRVEHSLQDRLAKTTESFQKEIDTLRNQLASVPVETGPDPELIAELDALKQENTLLKAKTNDLETQLAMPPEPAIAPPPAELTNKISELELDIQNLRALLDEKDAEINKFRNNPDMAGPNNLEELHQAKREIADLTAKVAELSAHAGSARELEDAHSMLQAKDQRIFELEMALAAQPDAAQDVKALQDKIAHLEAESVNFAETAMKLTALESEREKLSVELNAAQRSLAQLRAEQQENSSSNAGAKEELAKKDQVIADLRQKLEELRTADQAGEATKAEVEQLTNQIADQLLAIQKFEDILRQHQDKIAVKDQEINILQEKLANADSTPQPIHVSSESDIIANFIDFFDGLDSYLTTHPSTELQSLHRKLLDRLILPNQIAYLPVISEQFDPNKHVATDYFRSDRFSEKCIVFEVEKGYSQGEMVVKKAKVWVVQNLFECKNCGSTQSHSDSKFCHMCGTKMVAPNNLPVDNLPVFEPTSTTYLRFAERMIEKNQIDRAKNYLNEGLKLDANSVPVLVKLSDVHAMASEFEEAITCLQKASLLRPDAKIADRIKNLEVRNSIFQQARNLDLPPEELEKLVSLIQRK